MASSHFFRLCSITGENGILYAMQHNKRTLHTERGAPAHIDVSRSSLNYCLAGNDTPKAIATHAKVQMLKAGIDKPRKNAVMAVEIIFSLPIERHQQDTKPFFTDCYEWLNKTYAGELLAFDVHLDESAPHAHAVILPLIDSKLQGDKLKGDRTNIKRVRTSFYSEVGVRYGLARVDKVRLNNADKQSLIKLVLARLKTDSVMLSDVWACVRDAISHDPMPYAQILGIDKQHQDHPKIVKSFVDIKRSKGKGSFKT